MFLAVVCVYVSSAIEFGEFLSMYRRVFVLCKSVVSQNVETIIPSKVDDKARSVSVFWAVDVDSIFYDLFLDISLEFCFYLCILIGAVTAIAAPDDVFWIG